jgi:hypothetical protein
MKVTKKHKIYGVVLLLGLSALGADRTILTPKESSAAETPTALLIKPAEATAAPLQTQSLASPLENPVSRKLKSLGVSLKLSDAETKDAFEPPVAWTGVSANSNKTVESFAQAHRLSGVLVGAKGSRAMIDGKLVAVGQSLDGYKLVSVSPAGSAVFASNNQEITLRIEEKRTR